MVGKVAQERYDELVAQSKVLVETERETLFKLGDNALEVEPLQAKGGSRPSAHEDVQSVEETLRRFADDVGMCIGTLMNYRLTAAHWPSEHRVVGVSIEIHRILMGHPDRFELIRKPPFNRRYGKHRWTEDAAKRARGWQVHNPVSVQEKVTAIHGLAADDQVAAQVAADLLRRPAVADEVPAQARVEAIRDLSRDERVAAEAATGLLHRPDVAFKAMSDDRARQSVNHAQVERGRQAREEFEQSSDLAPAIRRFERTAEFLDLVGACHTFVATTHRVVPGLRGRTVCEDEKAVLGENIARVRAALEWIEHAVETGEVDMDEALARLLRGE
ncbi:DUF6192 family protein [Streptomyces sp. NBC_00237]|uniref:DUF6192 family protein n=1 Tax=Streptomyces sp. NBC_00237 TaxID=2975687 RepID=UPI00224F4E0D|nr:DUF6192 family protein [Streptomyces sp. NBC_00237]MCX5206063.1 DUF6192 family protein [Streptomyces sp. NBC_00237]